MSSKGASRPGPKIVEQQSGKPEARGVGAGATVYPAGVENTPRRLQASKSRFQNWSSQMDLEQKEERGVPFPLLALVG